MRRYAPERPRRQAAVERRRARALPGGRDPEETPGAHRGWSAITGRADAIRRSATSATRRGRRKARCWRWPIASEDRTGNGVQIFDPVVGARPRPRLRQPSRYLGLTWRKDAGDLAVLRSLAADTNDRHNGAAWSIVAWTGVGAATEKRHVFDASTDRAPREGRQRMVAFRHPVVVGRRRGRLRRRDGVRGTVKPAQWPEKDNATTKGKDDATEISRTVDVWHAKDVDVMPKQKIGAAPRSAAQPARRVAARSPGADAARPRCLRDRRAAESQERRLRRELELGRRARSELGPVRRIAAGPGRRRHRRAGRRSPTRVDDRHVQRQLRRQIPPLFQPRRVSSPSTRRGRP